MKNKFLLGALALLLVLGFGFYGCSDDSKDDGGGGQSIKCNSGCTITDEDSLMECLGKGHSIKCPVCGGTANADNIYDHMDCFDEM